MAHRIVAFGEILWDLLPTGRKLGGAPFNFVYRVASLGDRGIMISRLGRDELGREAHGIVRGLGMDTRCIQWDDTRPTGTVPITFDARGVADITINPDVAYDYIQALPEAVEECEAAECVCYGILAQRTEVSRRTLRTLLEGSARAIRLLDLNLRRDCWSPETVRASIRDAQVLKLNDDEAATVAGLYGLQGLELDVFARELIGRAGLQHVVITLGDRGALAASRAGLLTYVPGYRVKVVDTLGSGDAFTAGFVHGLLEGWSLERAVRHGNLLGALVAAQRGATEPLGPEEIRRMEREGRPSPPDPRFGRLGAS